MANAAPIAPDVSDVSDVPGVPDVLNAADPVDPVDSEAVAPDAIDDNAIDDNPVRALRHYLKCATPQLKDHVENCREELGRRATATKQRLETAQWTVLDATKKLETAKSNLALWKRLLSSRKDGAMRDPEEELDDDCDVGEEDYEAAFAFFQENDQNVALLRDNFPLHAQMWYGDVPTEDDVQEASDCVDAARKEVKDAKQHLQKVQTDLEEAQEENANEDEVEVADYDMENDVELRDAIEKTKANLGKKREREAALAKLSEEQRAKKARNAERRKEQAKNKRQENSDKLAEHADLVKYKDGYKRLKKEKLESQQREQEYAEQNNKLRASAAKAHENTRHERDTIIAWINTTIDKPEGWDAKRMFGNLQRFSKAKAAERDADKKNLPPGKVARKSRPTATDKAAKSTDRATVSAAAADHGDNSDEE